MGKSVHIRNRNGRLYIEVYLYGRQSRRSLGLSLTGDRAQDKKVLKLAELIRSMREMQLACVEWGIPDMLSNDRLLPTYIEENVRRTKNYTLSRCLHYVRAFRHGNIALSQVTAQWVEDFQNWLLQETGLSQGTASLYASALRHQLRLAVRDKLILSSPADFVRNIPMPESKKRPLSLLELRRLSGIEIAGKLGSEVRRAFLFSCFTGLRVSDLKSLRWNMFYTDDANCKWIFKTQKKTGTTVHIPLHGYALSLIGNAADDAVRQKSAGLGIGAAGCGMGTEDEKAEYEGAENGFVFPLLAKTGANTDQYLKKWGLRAGIEHVSWHTARHTFATIALEHGAELRTVSELLGHTDISTTLRYAKATDSLKKSAIASIPPLGGM